MWSWLKLGSWMRPSCLRAFLPWAARSCLRHHPPPSHPTPPHMHTTTFLPTATPPRKPARPPRGPSAPYTWTGPSRARTWRPSGKSPRSLRCVSLCVCVRDGMKRGPSVHLATGGWYVSCTDSTTPPSHAHTQMSKALDTSRKAVGGGGAKGGRAGRGARQQLDFIVEGMRSGASCSCVCVYTTVRRTCGIKRIQHTNKQTPLSLHLSNSRQAPSRRRPSSLSSTTSRLSPRPPPWATRAPPARTGSSSCSTPLWTCSTAPTSASSSSASAPSACVRVCVRSLGWGGEGHFLMWF